MQLSSLSTKMEADYAKFDFYDEESGKWIHIADYLESYNNYTNSRPKSTPADTFSFHFSLGLLLIPAVLVVLITLGSMVSFPIHFVVCKKNRDIGKEVKCTFEL
ncbi:hypothetical protein L3Y34_019762 [Caenorhabditis briggsae]|uniref:Uncharacterized protein n=1 Tax=Caenorhabditis briggsae TaxID=6238 RepID=A0AAE9DNM1_CAEBR|nr:hypothetical protein L3Y34_019762 [Caenorhabditis briggsae]